MRLFSALFILIALATSAHAGDHWKITSRGGSGVWAVTQTAAASPSVPAKAACCSSECTCGCNAGKECQCGKASTTGAKAVQSAPVQYAPVFSGSNCST